MNISIIDNDNFYAAGLIMALSNYFKMKNREIQFILSPPTEQSVDIIFQAIRSGTRVEPNWRHHPDGKQPLYFAITDENDSHLKHLYHNVAGNNILLRNAQVETIVQLVDQTVSSPRPQPQKIAPDPTPELSKTLTRREYEVLSHLKQGKTHVRTANSLGISVKTISTHKRSAMKKLNFRRSNELFRWMLLGGLSAHKEL
ncbi:response regulator transcription factor [Serratia fonticola]|nr:response regulator transcription factor [Serratia fonticola]